MNGQRNLRRIITDFKLKGKKIQGEEVSNYNLKLKKQGFKIIPWKKRMGGYNKLQSSNKKFIKKPNNPPPIIQNSTLT